MLTTTTTQSSSPIDRPSMSNELSINEFTNKCNDFIQQSKTMIKSALETVNNQNSQRDEEEIQVLMRLHIRNAMALVCSIILQCFESCYLLLYRNEKLDEIRQLLIQILNLLNTFRSSLNVAYLFALRKLNEKNSGLLLKQSSNLENDICFLIEYFKIIF